MTTETETEIPRKWQYRIENRPFQPLLTFFLNGIPKGFISGTFDELKSFASSLTLTELETDDESIDRGTDSQSR